MIVRRSRDDRVVVRLAGTRVVVLARIKVGFKDEGLNVAGIDGQRARDRLQRQRNVILLRVGRRDLEERRWVLWVQRERRLELRASIVVVLFGSVDASERHERPGIGLVEGYGSPGNALGIAWPPRPDVEVCEGREHAQIRWIEIGGFLEVGQSCATVAELLLREGVVVEYLCGFIAQLQQMLGVLNRNIGAVHLKVLGRELRHRKLIGWIRLELGGQARNRDGRRFGACCR